MLLSGKKLNKFTFQEILCISWELELENRVLKRIKKCLFLYVEIENPKFFSIQAFLPGIFFLFI